jgi:phospholipase C
VRSIGTGTLDAGGRRRILPLFLLAALCPLTGVTGCDGIHPNAAVSSSSNSPIKHVVVIMQENRTFDNFFHSFPGADSAQSGMSEGTLVTLSPVPLAEMYNLDNSHPAWWNAWDNGLMDGFAQTETNPTVSAYSYVPSSEIQAYWTLAGRYTLADRMFQSNTGPSFVAHQYMIAGQSGQSDENPSSVNWGCDAPPGSTVPLIGPNGTDLPGVFPCFNYRTMADLLDAEELTWRYYAPANAAPDNSTASAYEAIDHIFYGSKWTSNNISPQTKVLTDIATVTWHR